MKYMTEKIGTIKNPLTIIAIFAGIAEVSGTVVLPFIDITNQFLFIYFLILFPSILVVLFFSTLNFNNKALYAPSDYKNEDNYVKMFKYDIQKQANVEVKVSKEDSIINYIEELKLQISKLTNKITNLEDKSKNDKIEAVEVEEIISEDYEIQVTPFDNVSKFLNYMAKNNLHVTVYNLFNRNNSFKEHSTIWLGTELPLDFSKKIIKLSKAFYPHLKYIHLSGDSSQDQSAPDSIYESVYIGGATSTALELGLNPLSVSEFEELDKCDNIETFHEMIRGHY